MGHGCSDNTISETTHIVSFINLSLDAQGATPNTPLSAILHGSTWKCIYSAKIVATLCLLSHPYIQKLGLLPDDISIHTMHDGGAMDRLLGGIDYEKSKYQDGGAPNR